MPNQPQSQANSLLNLLNPYQQSTRDVRHLPHSSEGDEGEPESPSAMLLRELQGQSDEEEERERERYIRDDREGMSPTPTPSRSVLGLGLNTNPNQKSGKETTTTNSSEDDEQPPQSLMYANPTGSDRRKSNTNTRAEESPGPFRPAGSSSTSESRRSASTSPGPSTVSNYASGLDLESTVEPAVSPVASVKHVPTFREPPRPSRTVSGSSRGDGYLDPPLLASRKGKGKEKKVGGRKYHQVQESDDRPGEGQRVGKGGLNDYEKALWKWVNVDDLDGFLQEVS